MVNINVAGLKKVSKVYRDRLVAAGFSTIKAVVDAWESETLSDALGSKWYHAKRQIESAVEALGYEIVPEWKIRVIHKVRKKVKWS